MAAIELGIPYYIVSPSGADSITLNLPSDPNFVGYVDDITGLDMGGIRENAQVVVAGDGGFHGPFWRDRRPWTMTGFVTPSFPVLSRSEAQENLEGILNQALRSDGSMMWQPADGIWKQIKFRLQQPVRVTTGQSKVQKNFSIACVSADYRIYSLNGRSVGANGTTNSGLTIPVAHNLGNADSPPKFTIHGPFSASGNILIVNWSQGRSLSLVNTAIAAGNYVTVDLTGPYPTVMDNLGNNLFGKIDPLGTQWDIAVAGKYTVPGADNHFSLFGNGSTSASGLTIQWNDAWV